MGDAHGSSDMGADLLLCPFCGASAVLLHELLPRMRQGGRAMREFVAVLPDYVEGFGCAMPELEWVVRCRDCKEWAAWTEYDHSNPCDDTEYARGECRMLGTRDPDGYCAWGERKQAEQCEEGI